MRKAFILLILCITGWLVTQAQNSEFYRSVKTIMHDAHDGFRNIMGKEVSNSYFAVVWDCQIKVPGTIASRFVNAKGMYYEGALLQTRDTSDIRPVYNHYVHLLDSCLNPDGYKTNWLDNFYPGIENFKKVAYIIDDDNTPIKMRPPHVALEVTHLKEKGLYTLILYIYEH